MDERTSWSRGPWTVDRGPWKTFSRRSKVQTTLYVKAGDLSLAVVNSGHLQVHLAGRLGFKLTVSILVGRVRHADDLKLLKGIQKMKKPENEDDLGELGGFFKVRVLAYGFWHIDNLRASRVIVGLPEDSTVDTLTQAEPSP